jgi:ferredoxin/flavodoxin---NADP+ reductase
MTKAECAELRGKQYNATVFHLRKVSSELAIMRIKPDFTVPLHKPGQYTALGLGRWEPRIEGCQEEIPGATDEKKLIRRAYSVSCPILDDSQQLLDSAETRRWLEFYITLVRKSNPPPALTPRLFALRQGDRIYFGEKIAGHFTLVTCSCMWLNTKARRSRR